MNQPPMMTSKDCLKSMNNVKKAINGDLFDDK